MKTFYMMFVGGVFSLFCFSQMKGFALDTNQTLPKPVIFSRASSSSSSGGSHSSGWFFFSSK